MVSHRKPWGGALILGTLLILGSGPGPVGAEGTAKPAARGGDSRQFAAELQRHGAFKFYEDTEDILRAGRFEEAFGRYVFLHAHIRGRSLNAGLAAMVDQRLQFLRAQMHLGEGAHPYVPEERPERRRRRVKPAPPPCPPPEKAAKAKEPDAEEKPPEIIIPPAPVEEKEPPPPKEEPKPPGEEEQKPAPPPSFWEKLKRRLKFW